MELKTMNRRWAFAIAIVVCLVTPILVACGGKTADHAPDDAQVSQKRQDKKDGM